MEDNKENKQKSSLPTKISIVIGSLAGVCTIFNVVNNIINNPMQWTWAPVVISAIITIGGWGVAGYYTYQNRKQKILRSSDDNYGGGFSKSDVSSFEKPKSDIIREWFDDYIGSGEGHEYMKTIGSSDEQDFKINQMHNNLAELKEKHDTGYLESRLYYLYIFALLHGASKRVWAVSLGGEWIDTPEEKEFLRMNFEVAKRQIEFERFFVISKVELSALLQSEPVLKQIEFRNSFFKTYIAFKEDMDAVSPDIYRALGQGFLAFDDFAIADDRFQNDIARGYIFTGQDICKDFSLKFSKLRDFSQPLDKEFLDRHRTIVPSS